MAKLLQLDEAYNFFIKLDSLAAYSPFHIIKDNGHKTCTLSMLLKESQGFMPDCEAIGLIGFYGGPVPRKWIKGRLTHWVADKIVELIERKGKKAVLRTFKEVLTGLTCTRYNSVTEK